MERTTPMADGRLGMVLHYLRDLVGAPDGPHSSDGQLLERFVSNRDGEAFALLMQRYGPLVLGTCRRLLYDTHAAEDAFQATFLVLVRRAAGLRRHGSLAGWLYGVAYRIAVRARVHSARRHSRELPMDACSDIPEPTSDDVAARTSRDELRDVLDDEMQRLPAKYRAPLILCYLEGKTNEQAARELGRPAGSMSRHLARARELLQERLARRGLALGAALLGPVPAESLAAAVPPALSAQVADAALQVAAGRAVAEVVSARVASLAEGALHAMRMNQLKGAALFLLTVSVAVAGAGTLLYPAAPDPPPVPAQAAAPAYQPPMIAKEWNSVTLRHDEPVCVIALATDGRLLAAQSRKAVYLWEVNTGKEVRRHALELNDRIVQASGLAFSPDTRQLAWAGVLPNSTGAIQMWDVATGDKVRTLVDGQGGLRFTTIAFSPDGKLLAAGTTERAVILWDVASGKELRRFASRSHVHALAFSPNGKLLAASVDMFYEKRNGVFLPGTDKEFLLLWDVSSGKELRAWGRPHGGGACAIAFSPDGMCLVSGGVKDKTLRCWEVVTGTEIRSWNSLQGKVVAGQPYKLTFSPDGRLLSTGQRGMVVRFWQALVEENPPILADADAPAGEFALLADGRTIAAAHGGKIVRVCDVSAAVKAEPLGVRKLEAKDLAPLWEELGGTDTPRAYRALVHLAAAPEQSVLFLKEQLRTLPMPDDNRAAKLVASLASEQFATRQKAFEELEQLGELARAALEKALTERPGLEVQRRIEQLLDKIASYSPSQLRWLRAIAVLELAGTAAARQALESLTQGAAGPRLAGEARSALARLAKR